MAELVREHSEARRRAVEAHDDERVRARHARGERAAPLALIRVDVDPPLFQAAPADGGDVVVSERREGLADPLDALLVLEPGRIRAERSPEVVRLQRVDAEQRRPDVPVPMPGR